MKITKIYFPMVTAIKIEEKGMEPRYFTSTESGVTYPCEDALLDEEDWRRALVEAKEKGAKVEVSEM